MDTVLCQGSPSYVWNEHTIDTDADSSYVSNFESVARCDSIITLNVFVTPEVYGFEEMTVCEGSPGFDWNGQNVVTDRDSSYTATLTSAAGCDSIATLTVTVTPEVYGFEEMTVCEGSPEFDWNGQSVVTDRDSSYTATLTSAAGCDSIATLTVTVTPEVYGSEEMTVCEGSPEFDWNGQNVVTDRDSSYTATLTSAAGCDSIATLTVTVTPEVYGFEEMTVCEGSSEFDWNGQTVVTDRDSSYTATLTSAAGCDSIATLTVTISSGTFTEVFETACDSYTWTSGNGNTYTETGIFDYITSNADGCEDTLRLNLTITETVEVTVTIAADQTEVTDGDEVTFTATPVNGGTNPVYAWFVNAVQVSGESSVNFAYTPEDGDVVYATLLSDLDCAAPKPAESNKITLIVNERYEELVVDAVVLPIACYGDMSGGIDLTVTGASGNYTFEWSNGATTEDIYDLAAGTYTVTVTDAIGVSAERTIEITQPSELVLSATKVDVGFSPDPIGSINLTVSGGTGPYSYAWTGPDGFTASTQDISKLEGGAYVVVVTDANNCEATLALVIEAKDPDYWMDCPPDLTFDCVGDEDPIYRNYQEYVDAGGSAFSDCGLDIRSFRGEKISQTGSCPTTILRRYSMLDLCGNPLECFQTIVIDDNEKPRFPINPYPTVVECIDDVPAPFTDGSRGYNQFSQRYGDATDNCGIDESSFTFESETITEEICPKIITVRRQYSIRDLCGNPAFFNERIEVIDEIAPEITCPAPAAFEAELSDLAALTGLAYSETEQEIPLDDASALGLTLSDNCRVISLSYHDVADGSCPTTIGRTFTVSDGCNEASCTQIIELNYELTVSVDLISDKTVICEDETVTFTAIPENGGDAPEYRWFVNDVEVPGVNGSVYAYNPQHGDEVYVELTSGETCVVSPVAVSNRITITVTDGLEVNVVLEADKETICEGETVTFTANPENGGDDPVYAWFVNGVEMAGETASTFVYQPADTIVVYATLTSSLGCVTNNPFVKVIR